MSRLSQRKDSNKPNKNRRSLIHQTDVRSAEAIVRSQRFNPGTGGLYGGGIYFANTIEACDGKALHKGVYLIADVYLGRTKAFTKSEVVKNKVDPQKILSDGYHSVVGTKMKTGREFVVYDPDRVKNIKYMYGTRIEAQFREKRKRYVFFLATDHQTAAEIVQRQHIRMTEGGPFGDGFYMYDSLQDALQVQQGETYLAADCYMKSYYKLKNNEKITSRLRTEHKSFKGKLNGMCYYIFADPSLIRNIHYCGGRVFDGSS